MFSTKQNYKFTDTLCLQNKTVCLQTRYVYKTESLHTRYIHKKMYRQLIFTKTKNKVYQHVMFIKQKVYIKVMFTKQNILFYRQVMFTK